MPVTNPSGIGVGQTWQSVARAAGITYTNNTNKPIQVTFLSSLTGVSQNQSDLSVNGVVVSSFRINTTGGSWGISIPLTAIVPPNGTYMLTTNGVYIAAYELR